MKKLICLVSSVFVFFFIINTITPTYANNLSISNVTLEERDPSNDNVVIEFDIQWENSWKTKINHDAVWLTIRLYNPTISPTEKKLCQISTNGLNPTGTSVGNATELEIYVPADKNGVFIRPSAYGNYGAVAATDVQLTIDYNSCGFSASDQVYASIFGLEMVLIPEGAFYAGDSSSTAAFDQGTGDADPWQITSETAIAVSNPVSNGYRYISAGNAGENATGSAFTVPAAFPKGYSGFYLMKYEITEGQWVDFFNSLGSSVARSNRDLTDNLHKNTDTVNKRNTISCSGSPLVCSSQRPARAVGYMTWSDLSAFLDWAALRPMTELEFEKASRGPKLAVADEFAWGSTNYTFATTVSGALENGTETITDSGANVHFNSTVLSGGDAGNGVEYAQGPLRAGIFATGSSDRESSGAGYYGVMELSGNIRERVVTIGNANGRNFLGTQGDGNLTSTAGYEGNATNSDWPGYDADPTRGVTGALGSGFKGGGWDDQLSGVRLRVSDRQDAANGSNISFSNAGGRGVRNYEE